jgi:hypothetical protein
MSARGAHRTKVRDLTVSTCWVRGLGYQYWETAVLARGHQSAVVANYGEDEAAARAGHADWVAKVEGGWSIGDDPNRPD